MPRTITSTWPLLREIAAGADSVAPGSSWVLLTPVQPEPGTHDMASMPLSPPRQNTSRIPLPRRTDTAGEESIVCPSGDQAVQPLPTTKDFCHRPLSPPRTNVSVISAVRPVPPGPESR